MKNFIVTGEEKKKAKEYFSKINDIVEDLEVIRKSPALISDVKESVDFLSEDKQEQILADSIKSIEEMAYYLRFKEDDTSVELFRNLDKIIRKEMKRIKEIDYKALDKITKNKHNCVSFLDKNLVDKKMKSQEPNYEYFDKLTGFLNKRGKYKWSNEKIDELFTSLMK